LEDCAREAVDLEGIGIRWVVLSAFMPQKLKWLHPIILTKYFGYITGFSLPACLAAGLQFKPGPVQSSNCRTS
jgi:hypothetical protein